MTWLLPMLVSSCSLMKLDQFDASPCQVDTECEAAAHRFATDPPRCGAYSCQQGLCVWQDGKETCNGKDDDCDGLIDEQTPPDAPTSATNTPSAASAVGSVSYATLPSNGPTYVAVGDPSGDAILTTIDGASEPATLRYDSAVVSGDRRCPESGTSAIACNFAEVALTADARHLVFVAINRLGCAFGQVRVGLGDLAASPSTVWLGKTRGATTEQGSNIAFGVDVGQDGCTGATRAPDETGMHEVGARSPAVASVSTSAGAEGALALWLATRAPDPAERSPSCATPASVAVEALGVYVPAGEQDWLQGSDDGKPRSIGRSTSLSPPAVVALSPSGAPARYLVAFAAEDDEGTRGVQLLAVAAAAETVQSETARFIPDVAVPDQVALAIGGSGADGPETGLVWSSGCGAATKLQFAVVPGLGVPQLGPLLAAPNLVFRPQLLYRAEGFSVEPPNGGWFVLWVEEPTQGVQDLKVARITEGTLKLLNHEALRSGGSGFPLLYPVGSSDIGYGFVRPEDATRSRIDVFPKWCIDRG